MAVYVDHPRQYGRSVKFWSHLWADTESELFDMSDKIGLRRGWIQRKRIVHFDVSPKFRDKALKAGALIRSLREVL
jgi:hypothetical protein